MLKRKIAMAGSALLLLGLAACGNTTSDRLLSGAAIGGGVGAAGGAVFGAAWGSLWNLVGAFSSAAIS